MPIAGKLGLVERSTIVCASRTKKSLNLTLVHIDAVKAA
jgi:hypothetical protein